VDINTGGIADSFANFVWEPAVVKVFQDSIKFHSFFVLGTIVPVMNMSILCGYLSLKSLLIV